MLGKINLEIKTKGRKTNSNFKKMTSKKGFTLIELLVVIAIIGILSGLIIVSMSSANNSAKNARIQSDLDQLRTVAMLYSLGQSPNTYVGYSGAGTSASVLIADILTQAPATQPTIPAPTATGYCAVYSIWPTGSTSTYWCVDSAGNSTRLTGTLSNCSGAVTTCR